MAPIKPASDLRSLLQKSHAQIYRISIAICGDRWTAEKVLDKVVGQSARIFKRWETDEDARRWFARYTVLLSRMQRPPAGEDVLQTVTADPRFINAIRAIRLLPMQQREAFLLHHGEQMDLQHLATAMDCSTAAAANHLVAAVNSLKSAHLEGLGDFTTQLPALLHTLLPKPDALRHQLEQAIAAQTRAEKRRRWLFIAQQVLVLLAIVWLVWWMWQHVEFQ